MVVSLNLARAKNTKSDDHLVLNGLIKPSLIGMSREEIGDALREAGIAEKQIKMRVSQIWHWLYVRGISEISQKIFAHCLKINLILRALKLLKNKFLMTALVSG